MGVFCHLDKSAIINALILKTEYLETLLWKTVKFKVVRETKEENAIGKRRFCLNVILDETQEIKVAKTPKHNDEVESSEDDLQLSYGGSSSADTTLKACEISEDHKMPEVGSKILIFNPIVETPTCFWACIRTEDDLTGELLTDSLAMRVSMNDKNVFNKYQKLMATPTEDDMVIALGSDNMTHRGMVKDVCGSNCNVKSPFYI